MTYFFPLINSIHYNFNWTRESNDILQGELPFRWEWLSCDDIDFLISTLPISSSSSWGLLSFPISSGSIPYEYLSTSPLPVISVCPLLPCPCLQDILSFSSYIIIPLTYIYCLSDIYLVFFYLLIFHLRALVWSQISPWCDKVTTIWDGGLTTSGRSRSVPVASSSLSDPLRVLLCNLFYNFWVW